MKTNKYMRILPLLLMISCFLFMSGETDAARVRQETASTRMGNITITEIMYNPLNNPTDEFVELYNTTAVDIDISGYQLKGEIDYTFPANTILAGDSYIVVAKDTAATTGAMGPYLGSLNDSGGALTLYSKHGVLLVDAEYNDNYLWPKAADGYGHSLVLAHPDFGEANPLAYAASASIGGSKGGIDIPSTTAFSKICINEIVIDESNNQLKIEFLNQGSSDVNLQNSKLLNRAAQEYTLPSHVVPAKGRSTLTISTVSFSAPLTGGSIALRNAGNTEIADALSYDALPNNAAFGRFPDGDAYTTELSSATLGSPNTAVKAESIVINEIMYNPISDDAADEFIELYNRSGSSLDISGWKIDGDVSYKIPSGTTIPSHGYLVIAKDELKIIQNYALLTDVNTVGNFSGTLSNSGGILYLKEPLYTGPTGGTEYRTVSKINFKDFWGHLSDGGGSSLELKDPNAHGFMGTSWADSDESAKSSWTTVDTGTVELFDGGMSKGDGINDNDYEFHIQMQGAGECMVDNVQLQVNNSSQISNSTFDSNINGWIVAQTSGGGTTGNISGNHEQSKYAPNQGFSGGGLHVISTGRGESSLNHVEYNISADPQNGQTGRITAKARWLAGENHVIMRIRGAYLEEMVELPIPSNLGSPGAQNSQYDSNAGPSIERMIGHNPVFPANNQAVTITAKVNDNNGVSSVILKYRVDPSTTISSLTMKDDGSGVDAIANDGVFSVSVPGKASGSRAAFRIEMRDANNQLTTYPATHLGEALIRWGEANLSSKTFNDVRIWMTDANATYLNKNAYSAWSDQTRNCTLVINGDRVIHNAGIRHRGSVFRRSSPIEAYKVEILEGEELMGDRTLSLDGSHIQSGSSYLAESVAFWMAEQMGVPSPNKRWTFVHLNGSVKGQGNICADQTRPNPTFMKSRLPKMAEGELHYIDYRCDLGDQTISNPPYVYDPGVAESRHPNTGQLYEPFYRLVAEKKSGNMGNYNELLELVEACYDTGPNRTANLESLVDPEIMAALAVRVLAGDKDGWGWDHPKNAFIYKPDNGKWHKLIWDIDNGVFGTVKIDPWLDNSPLLAQIFTVPSMQRAYWRAAEYAANGPMTNPTTYCTQISQEMAANGITVSAASHATYLSDQRPRIINKLNSLGATNIFSVTSQSASGTALQLKGNAPLRAETIKVNGRTVPVNWETINSWSLNILLAAGNNNFAISAYDRFGNQVDSTVHLNNIQGGGGGSLGIDPTVRLKFDDATGTIADDLYNTKDGLLEGGASWSTDVPSVFSGGRSVRLDGSSGRVKLGDNEYRFPSGTYSLSMWFKLDAYPVGGWGSGDTLFAKTKTGLSLSFFNSTFVVKGPVPKTELGASISANQWNHFVFIVDGTSFKAQVNGSTIAANSYTPKELVAGKQAYIGYMEADGQYLNGYVDDFQMYDGKALTADEINHIRSGQDLSTYVPKGLVSMLNPVGNLVITELMYNPLADNTQPLVDKNEFEFIELYNKGNQPLYLGDLAFVDGINFSFADDVELAAGEYAVIVKNHDAFVSRYGSAPRVMGVYSGQLSNGGEKITLIDSASNVVCDITYDTRSPWPKQADGSGPSLELKDPINTTGTTGADWGANSIQGTPGVGYSAPTSAPIQISEILAHTDAPLTDAIELYNPTSQEVDIGGWYLSDTSSNPRLFQIPANKKIPAKGYTVIRDDNDGNPSGYPSVTSGYFGSLFQLSSHGDEISLYDSTGASVTTVKFGASKNGVSFGRTVTTDGVVYFPWMESLTLGSQTTLPLPTFVSGAANSNPRIGPLVISEILPMSSTNRYEFVEIVNISGSTVNLYDDTNVPGKSNPDNTYELNNIGFAFPKNISMAPNEVIVLTDAPSEAVFRAIYPSTPSGTQIFLYSGGLKASGERLQIEYPDTEDILNGSTNVPYIVMDEVDYAASTSWPTIATNQSIERIVLNTYGNEPTHWQTSAPTPGDVGASGNVRPVARITTTSATTGTAPLTVNFDGSTSSDTEGPIQFYAWDFDGDGSMDSTAANPPPHTYNTPGNYGATLTVTDMSNATHTATMAITVNAATTSGTLTAIEAASLYTAEPDTAKNNAGLVSIKMGGSSYTRYVMVRFDVSQLLGTDVTSATLNISVKHDDAQNQLPSSIYAFAVPDGNSGQNWIGGTSGITYNQVISTGLISDLSTGLPGSYGQLIPVGQSPTINYGLNGWTTITTTALADQLDADTDGKISLLLAQELGYNISVRDPLTVSLDYSAQGSSSDPHADPDGDGYSNFLEDAFGMNPNVSDAWNALSKTSNGFQYEVRNMKAGYTYKVQTTANLVTGPWSTIQTISAAGGPTYVQMGSSELKKYIRTEVSK